MKREKTACHCHNVSYGEIIDAVQNGASTYVQVQEATGAGTGCGKCREFVETLIRDINQFPEDYR